MKKVRMQALVDASRCTGCDTCVHVCPTMAYLPPTERPVDRAMMPPCNLSCPAGNDIESFVALTRQDRWDEAAGLLLEGNPLPGVTGAICPAPCQKACNRGHYDQAIAIKAMERALAALPRDPGNIFPAAPEGQEVAVIGAGTAGLTCAFHLAKQGFRVTVYEQEGEIGGGLRRGKIARQLEVEVLDRDLALFNNAPIDFRLNQAYGRQFSLADLAGYAAVYFATGRAQAAQNAQAEGKGAALTALLRDNGDPAGGELQPDKWGRTGREGLFAGGALVSGREAVEQSIGSGRRGAMAIAAYLGGQELIEAQVKPKVASFSGMNPNYYESQPSLVSAAAEQEGRGAMAGQAQLTQEAARCFSCGVTPLYDPANCRGCTNCSSRCPSEAISLQELPEAYTIQVPVDPARQNEIERLCVQAKLNPESIVCYCTSTRADEIAAAILQGARTPEDISRSTGVRTGCGVLCIEPVFRLMLAAGLELGLPPQSDLWYPTVPLLHDLSAKVIEQYEHRGFHFEEDKEFLKQYLRDQ